MLQSVKFRHVVFPNDVQRLKKVINFAVQGDLPAALVDPAPAPSLSEEQIGFLVWLFAQAGLDAGAYRWETLKRRLPSCLRGLHVRCVAQARRLLEQEPGLVALAINAMLVGVTSFFRDPHVFTALRESILPTLSRGRSGLYVWSAGCSDGCELYSVGMLLADMGRLDGSYLLGTDCRADAIQRARTGVYEALSCKNVPSPYYASYFTSEGPRLRVEPALRRAMRWRTADLLKTQEPGFWDLILCRNTTMYMRFEATHSLCEKLEMLLRPGGVLVLGKAERPIGVKRLTQVAPCLYRRSRG
jgi:chemotaxis protein methyltransferase CheR